MNHRINDSVGYSSVPGGLLLATLVFTSILTSSSVSADDSVIDQVNVSVPASCSLSGTGMTSHNAEIQNGQYNSAIGETTLNAFCNDSEGFAIYAVGFTDNTYGKNVLTNSTLGSNHDIVTGTSTSGANSNWAMKLSTISSPTPTYPITIQNSYSSFHNVPSTYELVASRSSGTDIGQSAEGSTLKTTYQAYISGTQAAGTYTGQVKYTLVHPANETPLQPVACNSGKICYNPNGGNVLGTMGQPTINSSDTSAILLASNFSREGYGFAGWSDVYDYDTNPNAHFYGPNETITFTAGQYTGSNPGLSLYAVWVKSEGNLQDSTKVATLCGTGTGSLTQAPTNGTANLASVSALTDQRDNETYAIAKLADGNCWMIENLRLESTNSDNSTGALAQGYATSSTYGNFSGLATPEYTSFNNYSPASNTLYAPSTDGNKIVIGTTNYPYARIPRYNNWHNQSDPQNRPQNPTRNSSTNGTTYAGMYSYGNYYTWSAAIANTIYYDSPTATDADGKTSETVNTSICPAGWKLPRGGDKSREATNDFWALVVTGINNGTNPANYESEAEPYYTGSSEGSDVSKKLRAYPNNFLYSGYFNNVSVYSTASYGAYQSSTARSGSTSYILYLYESGVYPGTRGFDDYVGNNIRCISGS